MIHSGSLTLFMGQEKRETDTAQEIPSLNHLGGYSYRAKVNEFSFPLKRTRKFIRLLTKSFIHSREEESETLTRLL